MVDAGFSIVSPNYRLSKEVPFPAQIHDCKAVVRWARPDAGEYNLDPGAHRCLDNSAGGHLAALLGTTGGNPQLEGTEGNLQYSSRVVAVCDSYGITDLLTL